MTTAWAGLLIESTLKSSLCLGVAGLLALVLSRRSAAERHFVWAAAIVGSLLLPPLAIVAPRWRIDVGDSWPQLATRPQAEPATERPLISGETRPPGDRPFDSGAGSPGAAGSAAPPLESAPVRWSVPRALVVVWSLGALAALSPLALAFLRISRIAARSRPLDTARWTALADRVAEVQRLDRSRLHLRRAAGPITPLTWGIARPVVILPETCEAWSDGQAYEVLVHEGGHVQRHDCLTQLLASSACVLYWWNPLLWLAARRMLVERERACDDHVLQAGARPSDYAGNLLELARGFGAPWSTSRVTTAMARRSQISGRLLAILDPDLNRGTVGRSTVLGGAALGVLILLPLASAAPVQGTTVGESLREAQAPRPADVVSAVQQLRGRRRDYAAALARGDVEALAGFYTADARVAGPLLPVAVGRDGVRSLLQHAVDAGAAGVEFAAVELYPVGDLVCETGTARLAQRSGAPLAAGRYMTLWKSEAGTWRIHRDWASR